MNQRTSLLWSIGILSAVLLATLVLLSSAAQTQFSERFSLLLAVNAVGLITLLVLILANLRRLWMAVRRNVPGARLELRVLRMLVLLAILPLLVVYGFSLDFLRRGIDSWFDVRIEAALSDSLELSRSALDRRMREALKLTEQVALELVRGAPRTSSPLDLAALREPDSTVVDNILNPAAPQLDGYREQIGADELALLERNGNLLSASSISADIVPSLPSRAVMLQLRGGQNYIGLEPTGDSALSIRVAVNIVSERVGGGGQALHALFPIDSRTNRLASRVEKAITAYNELTYLRDKLKLSFVMTLTLVLLFSMFAAVWGALYVASRLA
ncbi:MAG: two-component sensor histidine kinase, partial [Gammaproteobacteria bacterium]|nr:two-component sensor histidine kinase [Gammaproteobacteria bacterium]